MFRLSVVITLVSFATIISPALGQSFVEEFLYGIKPLEPPTPRELPIAGKATFDFTFTDVVTVFRFSPDGRWIAVGLTDGTVRLRGKTDGPARKFRVFESAVTDLRFSSDGRQITAYSDEQNVVKTWDISPTGKILSTVTLSKPWQRTQSVVSLDGQYVALAGNQSTALQRDGWGNWNYVGVPSPYLRVYHARTGKLLSTFRPKGGRASSSQIFFGPVGSRTLHVVDGNLHSGGSVQVWDFKHPQPVDPNNSFSISRDSYVLYAGKEKLLTAKTRRSNYRVSISSYVEADVATADLEIIDWSTGKKSTLHPCPPLDSMVTRSDTKILSVSYSINAAALSPKADRIVALTVHADDSPYPDENPELILMDTKGKIIGTIPGVGISHTNLAFSPDGTRLAASSGKHVRFWELSQHPSKGNNDLSNNPESPKPRQNVNWSAAEGGTLKGHTENVSSVAFSPDGKLLVSKDCENGTINLWDTQTGNLKEEIGGGNELTDGFWVSSLVFSPDGKTLAWNSETGGSIWFWDIKAGKSKPSIYLDNHMAGLLAYSPDGKTLASVSSSFANDIARIADSGPGSTRDASHSVINLWDPRTRKLRRTISIGDETTHYIAFSPDGKTLASSSGESSLSYPKESTIKLWDARTGNLKGTRTVRPVAYSIAFSPDGRMMAIDGADGDKTAVSVFKTATITMPSAPPPPPPPSFAGQWDVPSGPLELTVQQNKVAGSYPFFGGQVEGQLSEDGKSVTGTWKQTNGFSGGFVLTVSPDNKQITGRRWVGNKKDDGTGESWSGEPNWQAVIRRPKQEPSHSPPGPKAKTRFCR